MRQLTPASRQSLVGLTASVVILVGSILAAQCLRAHPERQPGAVEAPGRVDVGFAQDMVTHHAQALVMAGFALDNATDPRIVALARKILVTQGKEIGILQGWLSLWQQPQLPNGPPMGWMAHHSAHASGHRDHSMPGMASQQQLDRLAGAHGADFDRFFLHLMIRHHVGGVDMASYAVMHAEIEQVRSVAGLMISDQKEEIATMEALAAATRIKAPSGDPSERSPS